MAKRQHPERTVLAFAGDGCFLMNGRSSPPPCSMTSHHCGGDRQRHVRHHPHASGTGKSRPYLATRLKNPDFAAYARAFGGHGERVERTEEFAPALKRALASGLPAILHCKLDPEAINPATTLTAIREAALCPPGPLSPWRTINSMW